MDAAFNLSYDRKVSRREKPDTLSIEDEEYEERLDRARSFRFKTVRIRSLASHVSNDTLRPLKSGVASVDEEKEENEADEMEDAPSTTRSKRVAPAISFHESPTFDLDNSPT